MAEKLQPDQPEKYTDRRSPEVGQEAHAENQPEASREQSQNLVHIRARAAEQALSAEETTVSAENADEHAPSQTFVNRELKAMAYGRTMNRVRKQLTPTGRLLSRLVHQPTINAISEVGAKTIGRPSGIIGGGVLAFSGTTFYYIVAKHYGYEYRFSLFGLLLVSGFVTGWVAELLWRLLGSGRR